MKKILLTGASGLLGRAIQRQSVRHADLDIFAISTNNLNLLDEDAVRIFFNKNTFDLVIHCAAKCVGLEKNTNSPMSLMLDNMHIDRNVILNTYNNGIKHMLYMGSSSVYPFGYADKPMKETDMFSGPPPLENEGYAYSKIIGGKMCEMINANNATFHYKTFLLCNLYGTEHKYEYTDKHLTTAPMAKIIASRNNGEKITIWGDGFNRREMLYVDDLALYILYIVENNMIDTLPTYLNVGANVDYSINEYYEQVAKIFGYDEGFIHDYSKPVGVRRRLMDSSLAVKKYGWSPSTTLEDGIKHIYQYMVLNNKYMNRGL